MLIVKIFLCVMYWYNQSHTFLFSHSNIATKIKFGPINLSPNKDQVKNKGFSLVNCNSANGGYFWTFVWNKH